MAGCHEICAAPQGRETNDKRKNLTDSGQAEIHRKRFVVHRSAMSALSLKRQQETLGHAREDYIVLLEYLGRWERPPDRERLHPRLNVLSLGRGN